MLWQWSSTGVQGDAFQLCSGVWEWGFDRVRREPEHSASGIPLYGDKLLGLAGNTVDTGKCINITPLSWSPSSTTSWEGISWQLEKGFGRQVWPEARAGEEWGFLGLGDTPPPYSSCTCCHLPFHLFNADISWATAMERNWKRFSQEGEKKPSPHFCSQARNVPLSTVAYWWQQMHCWRCTILEQRFLKSIWMFILTEELFPCWEDTVVFSVTQHSFFLLLVTLAWLSSEGEIFTHNSGPVLWKGLSQTWGCRAWPQLPADTNHSDWLRGKHITQSEPWRQGETCEGFREGNSLCLLVILAAPRRLGSEGS